MTARARPVAFVFAGLAAACGTEPGVAPSPPAPSAQGASDPSALRIEAAVSTEAPPSSAPAMGMGEWSEVDAQVLTLKIPGPLATKTVERQDPWSDRTSPTKMTTTTPATRVPFYVVAVSEVTAPPSEADKKILFDAVQTAAAKRRNGTITSSREFVLGAVEGREFTVVITLGETKVRSHTRVYVIGTTMVQVIVLAPDEGFDEATTAQIFDSMTLKPRPPG